MTKTNREQLLEAIDFWRESNSLYPWVKEITRLIDLERRRLELNMRYEQLLVSEWLDKEVPEDDLGKFVADAESWRKEIVTEILSNGYHHK